ncbi:hypothetical protein [Photobacterium kagoshimensis]|uniref:hypothetical protein n=1 Tax=Photobacterium kagoshimensis TaxID=2910242 RepID=UPI003D14092D
MRRLISCLLIVSFGFPALAWAKKDHHHDVIVVKHKKHKHKHKHKHHHGNQVIVVHQPPPHKHYHRSSLPEIATFAVIAGVSYAIIDNVFYKKSGERYEYVEKPLR